MSTTATEIELERQVREEQEEHDRLAAEERARREADGQGKLVELPKIKILVDEADPTKIVVHFTGDIVLERGDAGWIEWFNRLKPGKTADLSVGVFVPNSTRTHRRDKEGDVHAVVQTTTLIVTDVYLDDEPDT